MPSASGSHRYSGRAWVESVPAIALAALVVVALVAGVPRLFEPSTGQLFEAMRRLGPISGWRCARQPTYVYEPGREGHDATLLDDAPEATVVDSVPGVQVDRVEADLHGGDTTVWTRVVSADGRTQDERVYVLSPGKLQAITAEPIDGRVTICNSHLGDWQIVGEQTLGQAPSDVH